MTTITQVVTALPTAPARNQAPATFITNADAFVAALPAMVTQQNTLATQINTVSGEVNTNAATATTQAALAATNGAAQVALATDQANLATTNGAAQVALATTQANNAAASATSASTSATNAATSAITAVNAPGTSATSTTSLTVGLGVQSLTIQTGKSLVIGMYVVIASTVSPANNMFGNITSYDSSTGALVVNVTQLGGSGAIAAWTVSLSGAQGGTVPPIFKTYALRSDLRALDGSAVPAVVESLGLFTWVTGSTEPDDDETCFATATGAWELRAADPDYVFASWLADFDNVQGRATDLETRATADEAAITVLNAANAKILRGSFSMTLTSLATITSSTFTATVTGAATGDNVFVTPGNSFGTAAADQGKLSFAAYVSATDTVTVSIRNASASTASMTASTWSVLVIKQ